MECTKAAFQLELADAVGKQEEAQREVKNWEIMYNDWMKLMEESVGNINRTHIMLEVTWYKFLMMMTYLFFSNIKIVIKKWS